MVPISKHVYYHNLGGCGYKSEDTGYGRWWNV